MSMMIGQDGKAMSNKSPSKVMGEVTDHVIVATRQQREFSNANSAFAVALLNVANKDDGEDIDTDLLILRSSLSKLIEKNNAYTVTLEAIAKVIESVLPESN